MPVQKISFWNYFWLAKYYFRIMGILPVSESLSTRTSDILSIFLRMLPLFYGSYLLYQPINFILFRSHTVDELLEAVIIVIAVSGGVLRSILVIINGRKIGHLFRLCDELWDHAAPEDYVIISPWARKAKLFTMAYFFSAQFCNVVFVSTSTMRQLSLPPNFTIRYYPYGLYEDSDPRASYVLECALQAVIGVLGMLYFGGTDMAGTLVALNMCGQFALIRSWLTDTSNDDFSTKKPQIEKRLDMVLRKCGHRHKIVISICAKLETAVRDINLIQILSGTYMLAISGARLTVRSKSYKFLGPLVLAIGGLFFSCLPADDLYFASEAITEAVYGVPWYHCSRQQTTAVIIMLARSQRPAKLTAGRFVTLSLQTFSSIMSNSVSFCMVLNSF